MSVLSELICFTGAMYGFLLDEFISDWKQGLGYDSDLGELLQAAAGISELKPFEDLDLEIYSYTEITNFETIWVDNYRQLIQEADEFISGTVLRIASDSEFKIRSKAL